MIAFLAAAAVASVYNCEVGSPQSIRLDGDTASARKIGLPEEIKDWQFVVTLDSKSSKVSISWPGNPIQAHGESAALPIGKNAYAFAVLSRGPCLFTEDACMSLFTLADQPDGTAEVMIVPAALATDSAKDQRKPFLAVLQGRCSRAEVKR
jgi:hypothetical protein